MSSAVKQFPFSGNTGYKVQRVISLISKGMHMLQIRFEGQKPFNLYKDIHCGTSHTCVLLNVIIALMLVLVTINDDC